MSTSGPSPKLDENPSQRVDPEILGAALEMLDRGQEPDLISLASRFPESDEEILAALEAVHSYHERLVEAKRVRVGPGDDVLEPGTTLGDYTIVGLLGRGAMGLVYRARQGALGGRGVALKVLPTELVARDPRFLERFRREAKLASQVHAPNVAEVYDFGSADGRYFFAMRLVEGPSLAEALEELARHRRLGRTDHTRADFVRQAASLVRDVARALAAVHTKGLVHRDVKPSNIILERAAAANEADLAGVPILVDFGLLRPAESSDLTGAMTVLGTPAFAAPEVKLGHGASARSDTFSLGVVLHDLLTLTRPVDRPPASTGFEGLRAVNPGVDARLAAIVEKSLEEKPALRYADGAELADDLDRYLGGHAVRALPTRPWSRLSLWVRRHPVRAIRRGSLVGLLVFLVIPTMVLGTQAVVRVYSIANSALAHDEEGELGRASIAYRELRSHRRLASILPGLSQAAKRAEAFAIPSFDSACRELAANAEDLSDHAHQELLRLLFAPDGKEFRNDGFRFLAWELQQERSMARRVMAARTCAHFLLVEPRPFLPPPNEEEYRQELDQLATALARAAREDWTEGQGLEMRRYAVSALSGMGQPWFDVLIEMLDEEDLELKSIASDGASRAWHQCYSELHKRPSAAQELIDQDLLARWATATFYAARKHLVRTRSVNGYSSAESRTTRKDNFLNEAGGGHLRRIALSRAMLEKAGLLAEWPQLSPDLESHLLRLQAVFEGLLEGGRPVALKPNSPELFRGWSDVRLTEDAIMRWNYALLVPEDQHDLMSDREPHKYENIWERHDPVEKDSLIHKDVDIHATQARLFLDEDRLCIDGSATRVEWTQAHPHFTRFGPDVPFHDFGAQGHVLQLASPGVSEVLFLAAKPEGAIGATVYLYHEVPSRPTLPLEGTTKIEVDLCDGEVISVQDLRVFPDRLGIALPFKALTRNDEIRVRIRYLDSDAIYWLWKIIIDFKVPAPNGD